MPNNDEDAVYNCCQLDRLQLLFEKTSLGSKYCFLEMISSNETFL